MRGDVEDIRRRIAYLIRAELVCCDIYDKINDFPDIYDSDEERDRAHVRRRLAAHKDGSWHDICYFGEWSARLAESGDLPEHAYYDFIDQDPKTGERHVRP